MITVALPALISQTTVLENGQICMMKRKGKEMQTELKPCRRCGATAGMLRHAEGMHMVYCFNYLCACETGWKGTAQEAAEEWNGKN